MTRFSHVLPERSELDVAQLDERARTTRYVLYPSDATDEELETVWIEFEERDAVPFDDLR